MADNESKLILSIDNNPAVKSAKDASAKVTKSLEEIEKKANALTGKFQEIGNSADKAAGQIQAAAQKGAGALTEEAKAARQLAVLQEQGRQKRATIRTEQGGRAISNIATTEARAEAERQRQMRQRENRFQADIGRAQLITHRANEKLRTAASMQEIRARSQAEKQAAKELESILNRTAGLRPGTRQRVAGAIGGEQNKLLREQLMASGLTQREAFTRQLRSTFGPTEAAFLAGAGGRTAPVSLGGPNLEAAKRAKAEASKKQAEIRAEVRQLERIINRTLQEPLKVQQQVAQSIQGIGPAMQRQRILGAGGTLNQAFQQNLISGGFGQRRAAGFVGGGAGGGNGLWRGGGWQRIIGGGAGGFVAGALGGFGIGVGGYAAARGVRSTIEATETAVAYERQRVAAEKLAGSQDQLNALMEAYSTASGGAIDKSQTLNKVTRLLATGFADTVPDVERFVAATRGASIALGKPQDYVIQETQLAISNTSVKRLDQIGLGISEVQDRIKELRKENAGMTREIAFGEAVLGLMEEKYGSLTKTMAGQKTGVEQLQAAWSDLMLAFGQAASGPVNRMAKAFSDLARSMMEAAEARERILRGEDTGTDAEKRVRFGMELEARQTRSSHYLDDLLQFSTGYEWLTGTTRTQTQARRVLNNPYAYNWPMGGNRGDSGYEYTPPAGPPPSWRERMGEDKMSIIDAAWEQSLQIEKNYHRQRLDAIRQYEEQRASTIRDFNKQMAREEEDFQRQRARSERDYQRAIVDLLRDSQERRVELQEDYFDRLQDLQEDLDERIADAREDSEKRIKEIQEKYQKDRERAEAAHRDRLLSAAARLDAMAVYEEQKRWARENKEREEGHKEALDQEKERLDEQIAEAQKAHDKQVRDAKEAYEEALEDQRKAEEKRLEEMRVNRARQLEDENEDRRIRLERAKQDHNDQLGEMDRQHGIMMTKLAEEAEAQRELLQTALEKDLAAVGHYIEGYQDKMEERDKAIERWFDQILKKIEDVIKADEERKKMNEVYYPGGGKVPAMAGGGYMPSNGYAYLHAGEYVLPSSQVAAMGGASSLMMGGSWNGDVTVNIAGSTNMGENEMYRVARKAFVDALREVQPS